MHSHATTVIYRIHYIYARSFYKAEQIGDEYYYSMYD